MPNQLPLSDLARRLGLRPEQKPAPVEFKVNGRSIVFIPERKTDWNRIITFGFIILWLVVPIVLGIIAWINSG